MNIFRTVTARMSEPSTWAGVGLLIQSALPLVASKGADPAAWAGVCAGLGAIFRAEGGG